MSYPIEFIRFQDCNVQNPEYVKRFDLAVTKVRSALGGFDRIASIVLAESGCSVRGSTIRGWFADRQIPIEFASVMVDCMAGEIALADFFPWLVPYFTGEEFPGYDSESEIEHFAEQVDAFLR